jgi:hypothetical protein
MERADVAAGVAFDALLEKLRGAKFARWICT